MPQASASAKFSDVTRASKPFQRRRASAPSLARRSSTPAKLVAPAFEPVFVPRGLVAANRREQRFHTQRRQLGAQANQPVDQHLARFPGGTQPVVDDLTFVEMGQPGKERVEMVVGKFAEKSGLDRPASRSEQRQTRGQAGQTGTHLSRLHECAEGVGTAGMQ